MLWAVCQLASRAGELETAHNAAVEMARLAQDAGDDRDRALATGKVADVLAARGEFDKALQIRRDEELPVYERLGDVRECAITLGQIADVLVARGDLDEALRIRRDEELPVYERLGDVQSRAITLGKVADVLADRSELDAALAMWRESLAVFQRLRAPDLTAVAHQRVERLEARRAPGK